MMDAKFAPPLMGRWRGTEPEGCGPSRTTGVLACSKRMEDRLKNMETESFLTGKIVGKNDGPGIVFFRDEVGDYHATAALLGYLKKGPTPERLAEIQDFITIIVKMENQRGETPFFSLKEEETNWNEGPIYSIQ